MKVSVIIPVRKVNKYIIKEVIPALKKQTYQNFELILIPDEKPKRIDFPSFVKVFPLVGNLTPAEKRDLGVKKAEGQILAFIDDDAFPDKNWLIKAIPDFNDKKIAAVCGPGITPKKDDVKQQVSGWFWSSWLGVGSIGSYRCFPAEKRFVDDYPTFNLLVRKKDFLKVGGFNSQFWPGEDTKLCQDLVYKLNKKIVYDPAVLVYHHRRPIFFPHLKQISRYGFQRGCFARIFPKTSRRLIYFLPSVFFLLVVSNLTWLVLSRPIGLVKTIGCLNNFFLIGTLIYLCLLMINSLGVFYRSRSLLVGLLVAPTVFLSHLTYGVMFLRGFWSKKKVSGY